MKTRLAYVLVAVVVGAAIPAYAGLSCLQSCPDGTCDQATCDAAPSGAGYCSCGAGALAQDGFVYAAWCRSSGQPDARGSCPQAPTAADAALGSAAVRQPDLRINDAPSMASALAARNAYVAALMAALQADGFWVTGPVEGQLHEIFQEDEAGPTFHSPAIRFAGQVVSGGIGAIQVNIRVAGDLNALTHLRSAVQSRNPDATVPVAVTGTITDQGLHGSLSSIDGTGRSETIQW